MDTDVQGVFTTLIPTVKDGVISTYAYLLPALVLFIVALWAIRFGWGKLNRVMRGGH